jgi:phosphoribosyl 1,2-cyclic phosphodiesterase
MSLGASPPRVDLLITHLHTDHIEGLRFFAPFWDPSVEFHIWGPPAPLRNLEQRIAPFFAPPFFPVHLRNVPSRPSFLEVPTEPWTIGSAVVTAQLIKHPGPAVGYRIEEAGRSLAYLPDHEPGLGTDLTSMEAGWISGLSLARDADVLVHDGQYTVGEYETRIGWGHSSTTDAVTFAERAGARRLVLFHHDPFHGDEQLEEMLAEARRLASDHSPDVELAYEGQTFEL